MPRSSSGMSKLIRSVPQSGFDSDPETDNNFDQGFDCEPIDDLVDSIVEKEYAQKATA